MGDGNGGLWVTEQNLGLYVGDSDVENGDLSSLTLLYASPPESISQISYKGLCFCCCDKTIASNWAFNMSWGLTLAGCHSQTTRPLTVNKRQHWSILFVSLTVFIKYHDMLAIYIYLIGLHWKCD